MKKPLWLFSFLFISLICIYSLNTTKSAYATEWLRAGPMEARLISAVNAVGDASTLTFGLDVKLDEGWKTYWRSPGDAGLPVQIDWSESSGIKNAELLYPAPTRFTLFGFDNFGYSKHVLFPLTATPDTIGKKVDLKISATFLICKEICVPQTILLTHPLLEGTATPSLFAKEISAAIQKIPEPVTVTKDTFMINATADHTIILSSPVIGDGITDLFLENSDELVFSRALKIADHTYKLMLNGHLIEGENFDEMMTKSPLRLTATYPNKPAIDISFMYQDFVGEIPSLNPAVISLAIILLFAFCGGLILNLMPCVLPVLSLKLLSIVSHGGAEKHEIRKAFLASAAGILFSFIVLATGLFIFKELGGAVGWGIQFQNPGFLIFMILLVSLFAINLWGAFEIPLPRFIAKTLSKSHEHEPTLMGHFLTGALATLLATPCSAPFLGTAVGFALSQSTFELYLVFLTLGFGLACPYLLVSAFPVVAKHLPKPGSWMVSFKKLLSIAMFLTAVWLASVLVNVLDHDNGANSLSKQGDVLQWVSFDPSKIQGLIKKGNVVFVDVTADWCLTCQANKKLVIYDDDIVQYMNNHKVVLMKADWTEPNDAITNYLKSYNRYGIPFNIIYGPQAANGLVLPELLTENKLLSSLKKAADPSY